MTFDYSVLNTIFTVLVTLGYDVQLVSCNDGLKVESISEGWDFAINSLTMGHTFGFVETNGLGGDPKAVDAREAIALVLSK